MAKDSEPKKYDYFFKVLMMGNSGVGKTSLMSRFEEVRTLPGTMLTGQTGIDFIVATVAIDGQRVKMQIWDTAGQERFKSITKAYYRGACGVVLVYDVRDRESFASIDHWLRDIDKNRQSEDLRKILVGNYNDDPDSKLVSSEEAEAFAQQNGMPLFEISSEDHAKVEQMFVSLARLMLQTRRDKEAAAEEAATIQAKSEPASQKCAV